MTDEYDRTTSGPTIAARKPQRDFSGAAFAAAIAEAFGRFRFPFGRLSSADEDVAGSHDDLEAYMRAFALANAAQEAAIRARYAQAELDWPALEARAAAHGIAFSSTAEAHHRAAILDYLDHPGAPTLISHKHMSWCHPIPTTDPDRSLTNWTRHLALCRPLADRDIAYHHAVRAELAGLRHLPPREAAMTAAALPRPQPRRLGQPAKRAGCG